MENNLKEGEKEMKYSKDNLKVGDKVLLKNRRGGLWNPEMDHYMGTVVTISELGESTFLIEEDDRSYCCWKFGYDDIERVANEFTRDDLQFGDIVTLRNGERYIVASYCLYGEEESYPFDREKVGVWYNNDLTHNENDQEVNIVKVERAGRVVYERGEEIKEMTVEEVSKLVGCKVKIVGKKESEDE